MKATTWFCPVLLTLLCATKLVCTAQRGGYLLNYAEPNALQDEYFLEKRNKPSLSIVNPLDVLRQRLLLEIARRQMKENSRQVEMNRAILKNVGKRMFATRRYQQQQQRQRQQQHFPRQVLDFVMPTPEAAKTFFDFLQQQRRLHELQMPAQQEQKLWQQQQWQRHPYALASYNEVFEGAKKSLNGNMGMTKHQLHGNEIGNETNYGKVKAATTPAVAQKGATVAGIRAAAATGLHKNRPVAEFNNLNWHINAMDTSDDNLLGNDAAAAATEDDNYVDVDYGDDGDDDAGTEANADADDAENDDFNGLHFRYLYRLQHNKHFAN